MNPIVKAIGRVVLGIGVSSAVIYADYRMRGGPPLRELYRTVKQDRIRTENENRKAMMQAVYTEGTVR